MHLAFNHLKEALPKLLTQWRAKLAKLSSENVIKNMTPFDLENHANLPLLAYHRFTYVTIKPVWLVAWEYFRNKPVLRTSLLTLPSRQISLIPSKKDKLQNIMSHVIICESEKAEQGIWSQFRVGNVKWIECCWVTVGFASCCFALSFKSIIVSNALYVILSRRELKY